MSDYCGPRSSICWSRPALAVGRLLGSGGGSVPNPRAIDAMNDQVSNRGWLGYERDSHGNAKVADAGETVDPIIGS